MQVLLGLGGLYLDNCEVADAVPQLSSIHPFLPMSYLVDALRVVISGGLATHLVHDVVVLAAMAVVALSVTVLTVARRQRLRVKDLHPPLVAP